MTVDKAIEVLTNIQGECSEDVSVAIKTAIAALEDQKPRGTYECFHCGEKAVVWQADFTFDDFVYDGDGIVHICTCTNCGAEIEYRISFDGDQE